MRSLLIAILAILCIGLFSCQKEVDDIFSNTGNNNTGNTSGLLVKTVATTGSDSLVTLYSYDNQKRLETVTMDGTSNGIVTHDYKKFIRDNNARVIRILEYIEENAIASDTSIEVVHYTNSGMDFDYTINTLSVIGFSTIDSTVYSYGSGNITSMKSYLSSPLFGATAIITKTDFSYDASGNLTLLKISSDFGGGPLLPIVNQSYTYGSAINANWMSTSGSQNLLLLGTPGIGNKAFSKAQVDDLTDPSNSFTITATYNLGAGGKPITATTTTTGGQVTNYKFYYQ
jgi:hypothetical protein